MILKNLKLQSISKMNCLFANDWLIFFFYVNDIMIICMKKNTNRMRFFEKSLMKRFEMRVLEKLKWFLKIRIIRNRVNRKIWFCQNSYIFKIMTKFYLKKMKISKTLLAEISRINEKTKNSNQSNSQLRLEMIRFQIKSFGWVPDSDFKPNRIVCQEIKSLKFRIGSISFGLKSIEISK
jgi:hypothetical protein